MTLLLPALFFAGVVESVQSLAFQSSVVLFNKPQFFTKSQGVVTLVENAPVLLSPFLGVAAYQKLGLEGVLLFDIVSFSVALATAIWLKFPNRIPAERKPWLSMESVRFIWTHPLLSRLQAFFGISNFCNGLLGGLLAAYVLSASGGNQDSLATVNTVMAVGSVLGSLFLIRGSLGRNLVGWITLGTMFAATTGRIGLALTSSVLMWSALLGIRSFLVPLISGANQVLWLREVGTSNVGSVFGARRVFGQGLYPLAVFLGGILSTTFRLDVLFIVVGVVELTVGAIGYFVLRQSTPQLTKLSIRS